MKSLLVLDFDVIYDLEMMENINDSSVFGVPPIVLLVNTKDLKQIEELVNKSHDDFYKDDNILPILDILETHLKNNRIFYQVIGTIQLPFEERYYEYLDHNINLLLF